MKRETLKLIETFLDKAEDQPQIGKQFVPPMMEPVLLDYARNLPDARESEVLSLFATIINKYVDLLLYQLILCFKKKKKTILLSYLMSMGVRNTFCYIIYSYLLVELEIICCWFSVALSNYIEHQFALFIICFHNFFWWRYKNTMIEDVPRIFEAVFQCTLEVRICMTDCCMFQILLLLLPPGGFCPLCLK